PSSTPGTGWSAWSAWTTCSAAWRASRPTSPRASGARWRSGNPNRPRRPAGRRRRVMATPMWVRTTLRLRGIPFEELHHPGAAPAQEAARREHFSGHRVAKVVVVMADGKPVELILPASRLVDLGRVRMVLGAREVRLASEEEMGMYFVGCEVG